MTEKFHASKEKPHTYRDPRLIKAMNLLIEIYL